MDRPLADVRVLDLGQIYQGPYCGMILGLLGADVVKVEPPGGENVRSRSEDGNPPQVQFLNPNKRGITLDLKTEAGRETLRELVEKADVLVENFSSGTMDDLGVGYEDLRSVNPELVYGHGSGYGNSGPYADYPAMDLTVQAMGGVMDVTGFPDREPVKAGVAVGDFLGGIHLATGIVSALYQRERTGEGQYVEVGMLDCIYPTLASPVAAVVEGADTPSRTGNRHSGLSISPYNAYEVADGYVVVICVTEAQWERLVAAMERPDLREDDRFESKVRRAENADAVDDIVGEWLSEKPTEAVVNRLREAGVPCAPVRDVEAVIDDDHLRERRMITDLPNRNGGDDVPVPGSPIKFSGSDDPTVERSPDLGEHTEQVLDQLLGYSTEEIERLREREAF